MTTHFICDPKIGASSSPFCAMRGDMTTSGAKLSKQMRQFVSQGAVDLGFAVIGQPTVE
ncbi:MAG TPA: hypothetical protein VGI60_00720 [Chthoniobacterales bacterium]